MSLIFYITISLGIMGLITVFFMGSGFGLHVPISFVMDDFCQKVDDYLTTNDTSSKSRVSPIE